MFTDGKGRATGETRDEWIAAVDLSSSFRVLSYSVAAPPVGGVGKQEVERGKQNASRTLEEQSAAASMGKKKDNKNPQLTVHFSNLGYQTLQI